MFKRFIFTVFLLVFTCSCATAATTIQIAGDTAARWSSYNRVLKARELACEQSTAWPYDCSGIKVGNGIQPWNNLPYLVKSGVYSPSIVYSYNLDSSSTFGTTVWSLTGNVATVSGQLIVDPTAANSVIAVHLTLPVRSALSGPYPYVLHGSGYSDDTGQSVQVLSAANGDDLAAQISFKPTGASQTVISYTYQYLVQ